MWRAEELARHFYEWERWGRGWVIAPYPVSIEPPFHPFFDHAPLGPVVDDGRKPTFLSSLADRAKQLFAPEHRTKALSPASSSLESRAPFPIKQRGSFIEFQVALPPTLHITNDTFEQFILSLAYCEHPLSFEIIGNSDSIILQMAVDENDAEHVAQQFVAHFPDAVVTRASDVLTECWGTCVGETAVVEFGLAREFMFPLLAHRTLGNDPLVALIGSLSKLDEGEIAVFQTIFKPTRNPWVQSIIRSVTAPDGSAFFENAPEMLPAARSKVSRPLFAAVIRIAARAESQSRLLAILKGMAGALTQFTDPVGNELIPLKNDGYGSDEHERDLVNRQSHRCGMLLNSDELLSLVHWPAPVVREEKLVRSHGKTKAAPDLVLNHSLMLGENLDAGEMKIVTLAPSQRVRHMHVVGASGTGKSTFLLNMILQDIDAGEGIAVLDPHGDLIDQILARIPDSRIDDVILLDPADEDWPIGFNILSAHSTLEKNLLASDLVSVFQRLSTSWGDQMTSVLGNTVLAFLESKRGGTLSDLRRFLIEPGFRSEFLETVDDSEVVYYWKKEYPLLSGRPQASILTRLDTFLRPKPIRHMVVQKENRLDFASIMNSKKIFLGKLAQGLIGVENSYLLGSFLVSKFHQLAMGRQDVSESSRQNFWLYVDEFQNFITPSLAAILSGARKYRLGLVLAHQELQQLESRDKDVASSVLSNAYTRVCFRLGDSDARKLAEGFSTFDAKDLQSLGTGEAICRIERSAFDFNLAIPPSALDEGDVSEERANRIIDLSRTKYAARREDVEAMLRQNMASLAEPQPRRSAASARSEFTESGRVLKPEIEAQKPPGKGGQQHKFIQSLMKQWGDGIGFRTTIEKSISDGEGSVDVALERGELSIACEISVTSTVKYEIGNLQKCLAAGYSFVLMIGNDEARLKRLRESAGGVLDAPSLQRVRFFTLAEAFTFIQSLEGEGGERSTRGYDVEVKSRGVVNGAASARQAQISDVLDSVAKRFVNRS